MQFQRVHVYCPKCDKRVGDGLSPHTIMDWRMGLQEVNIELGNRLQKHLYACKACDERDWEKLTDIVGEECALYWSPDRETVHEQDALLYLEQLAKKEKEKAEAKKQQEQQQQQQQTTETWEWSKGSPDDSWGKWWTSSAEPASSSQTGPAKHGHSGARPVSPTYKKDDPLQKPPKKEARKGDPRKAERPQDPRLIPAKEEPRHGSKEARREEPRHVAKEVRKEEQQRRAARKEERARSRSRRQDHID